MSDETCELTIYKNIENKSLLKILPLDIINEIFLYTENAKFQILLFLNMHKLLSGHDTFIVTISSDKLELCFNEYEEDYFDKYNELIQVEGFDNLFKIKF